MAGVTYQVGEQKIRPGIYIRTENVGEPPEAIVPQGTVATLFRGSWGPLGDVVAIESAEAIYPMFGDGGTTDALKENFRGGCRRVLGFRLGAGGAKATVTLKDNATTPVDVVKLEALYEGVRGNDFTATIRDSLIDETKRELLLYEGVTLRQTIEFAKGTDEPQSLVDAVKASDSPWITASKITDGTLAAVAQAPFTGGEDPTVTGEDYSTGLMAIEALHWNVLCVDTDDPITHAMVQTYVDRVTSEGKRILAVVGEPTSVELATRLANSRAFNDPPIHYVLNGFKGPDGIVREGYLAAARVAGMIAGSSITDSLTHAVVRGATEIVGALTNAEIEQALLSGAIVFTMSARKQVHIEQGINTFITPTKDMDAGWKKIRRVKTRYNLIDRITETWDPLVGQVDNDPDGRGTLIAAAQGIINKMASKAERAILGGIFMEDPDLPPAGDSAWFVAAIDDKDSAEKMYIRFGFRFSPGGGPVFGEV